MKTKQSNITFQSISISRSPVKHKICTAHPMKQAKYLDEINNQYFCQPCAIQLASQGFAMSTIGGRRSLVGRQQNKVQQMQNEFKANQQQIKNQMQNYNNVFSQIVDRLTDMQIKDLMEYNKLLKENEKKFKQKRGNFRVPDKEIIKKIESVAQVINQLVVKLSSSFSETLPSKRSSLTQNSSMKSQFNPAKNLKTLSSQSTIISTRKKTKPAKKSSEHQIKDNHQISFNQSLEDTPESVKAGMTGRIKALNQPVGMFDKIDICESLQDLHMHELQKSQNTNSMNQLQRDSLLLKDNISKSGIRYQNC